MTAKPEWINKGATVVIYTDTDRHDHSPKEVKVLSVAAKSFTVEHPVSSEAKPVRIQFDTLESKRTGTSWNRWNYAVVQVGSEKADKLFAAERMDRIKTTARIAADRWRQDDSPERLDALRKALDVLAEAQGGN